MNEDGYGGAFDGVRMVGRWGRECCWLGCGQKEMERDKNQDFPTVILSFLTGERESTVTIFDYSFQSICDLFKFYRNGERSETVNGQEHLGTFESERSNA